MEERGVRTPVAQRCVQLLARAYFETTPGIQPALSLDDGSDTNSEAQTNVGMAEAPHYHT